MRLATRHPSLQRDSRRAAFTLMEVLVVVAILVVLAGVGGVIFLNVQKDANKDVARLQMRELTSAAQRYAVKNGGALPESLEVLVQAGVVEPKAILDPWGKPFQYDPSGSRQAANSNKPDISTTSPQGEIIGNWE